MRNLKKFLALVLAMVMCFSLMLTVNASSFKDDDDINDNYAEAVNVLSALGIIQGDDNGNFNPKKSIRRCEVAAMIYRIDTAVDDTQAKIFKDYGYFTDVDPEDWFAGYVNFCGNAEFVKGKAPKVFAPHDYVTGYEVLAMVLRLMGYDQNHEFEGDGWHIRTAKTADELGILDNIKETLGQPATREMVAEILFQAMQKPMVTYNLLERYQPVVLAKASVDGNGNKIYDHDVYKTLLYSSFGIVGKRTIYGVDNYGRPMVEWVKDAENDTVQNGGKYIVNPQMAAHTPAKGDGVLGNEAGAAATVAPGASYVPSSTPGATFAAADDYSNITSYTKDSKTIDKTSFSLAMEPVKVYHDVVTECQLTKDVNGDNSIDKDDLTEWLNGAKVAQRSADLDILHTQEGTIGAPGRTTEVYEVDGKWVFVYVDTLMGVVTDVVPRTFDTNEHVMSPAKLTIKVNETVDEVVYTSETEDFADRAKGNVVLLTTYGGHNWAGKSSGKPTGADSGSAQDPDKIQTSVPTVPADFQWLDGDAATWAVDVLPDKPEQVTFNVKATVGAVNSKTGLISDQRSDPYKGNVVYLANEENPGVDNGAPVYYQNDADTAITTQTTVPGTEVDYGVAMNNSRIGQTVTAVLDQNGYVVGLTRDKAQSDIGVVTAMESVRIANGKYALEAEMFMMDGSTKTVRFLDNSDTNYNAGTTYDFWTKLTDADTDIGTANRKIDKNVLAKIEPFTKEGATYYKVVATHEGEGNTEFNAANVGKVGNTTSIMTGVANTLDAATTYDDEYPIQAVAANKNYINDNTKFIVAEYEYRYNQGEDDNAGSYNDLVLKTYTGFKKIPTITGAANEILWQKIGNNVFIYPETDTATLATNARRFTLRAQASYEVDDSYLVLDTVATYDDHATYKVLKDGRETTLDVSNNNLNTVNNVMETAKANKQLVKVTGRNSAGYATEITPLSGTTYTFAGMHADNTTCTIADEKELEFAKDGVLYNKSADQTLIGPAATDFLTVADDCKVFIVNLTTGSYVEGTLDSIMQYEDFDGNDDGDLTDDDIDSHNFVYELDSNGYASTIYIID